jgi:hypothetical protein
MIGSSFFFVHAVHTCDSPLYSYVPVVIIIPYISVAFVQLVRLTIVPFSFCFQNLCQPKDRKSPNIIIVKNNVRGRRISSPLSLMQIFTVHHVIL